MIRHASAYKVALLLNNDDKSIYRVPRYQREYTWKKKQWEDLFDDLHENDPGYFLGSIICLNNTKDSLSGPDLELIDGQQRMATISALMASLYSVLNEKWGSDSGKRTKIDNLKDRLVVSDTEIPRLVLQQQNLNNDDYVAMLGQAGVIANRAKPKNYGNRLLAKSYKYFRDKIKDLNDDEIWGFLSKLYEVVMVKIEVDSYADAYILFESLNNRGVPLTAVDIVKNNLLGALKNRNIDDTDGNFSQWQQIIDNLGNDYGVQDRYFRQYLNAFKTEFNDKPKFSIATRSNMIQLYEKLIEENPDGLLADFLRTSEIYAAFTAPEDLPNDNALKKPLLDLARIRGAAAYILLLYLFKNRESLKLDDELLKKIIVFLISFFVRRNITDLPPTRDLSRIFMDIINQVSSQNGDAIYKTIREKLVGFSASDEEFRNKLAGDLYTDNKDSTRFLLTILAESGMTRETWVDFWAYHSNGKGFVWTIEHILPQGDLRECWVDMIADGDKEKAKEIQTTHAHKIGNLTLSGFNSTLNNACFDKKRDMQDEAGNYIGYKNGLKLNEDLAVASEWKTEQIEDRTKRLSERILQLFTLN